MKKKNSNSNSASFENILSGIQHIVVEDSIGHIDGDFQASEVKEAFNQMAPLTTLGPDGMSPIFYKSFWQIVGEDVTTVVLRALNSSIVPNSINTTLSSPLSPKLKTQRKYLISGPLACVMSFINLLLKWWLTI